MKIKPFGQALDLSEPTTNMQKFLPGDS